ncbi:MAG: Gfo/Idh/MocA family oxidoreductase [Pirellulales bacterium]|nr:Gfo/Idh/MocA family oxidoreductase [Pirellulales bacterium]
MDRRTHRRDFLKSTALAGAGYWVACHSLRAQSTSANEKLNVGIIGVNHRGRENMRSVASENIVALCDIDDQYLDEAAKQYPKARRFNDWRTMLDEQGIDAVVISTTDHTHAPAAIKAMRTGKHVYVEKPLGHTVGEARLVRETYLGGKLATQMGTQIHATDNYRRVVELVRSGAVGPIHEVHVWCGRIGPGGGMPEGEDPVPSHLHWDLWIGPAPYRPYNKAYMPGNLTWNRYWDFGNGTIGDMGSHLIDLPYWALDLEFPTSCQAHGDPATPNPHTNPHWLISTWEHPAKGDRPAVKLTWYDGIQRPESPPGHDLSTWGIGVMFVGEKGKILADYGKRILLPEDQYKDYKTPEPWIPPSLGHHQEWIHACKTGAPTLCNFDYSGKLIEHNLLGNVAYRTGKKLQWDAKNLKAINCPEAEQYIHKKYREGWEIG